MPIVRYDRVPVRTGWQGGAAEWCNSTQPRRPLYSIAAGVYVRDLLLHRVISDWVKLVIFTCYQLHRLALNAPDRLTSATRCGHFACAYYVLMYLRAHTHAHMHACTHIGLCRRSTDGLAGEVSARERCRVNVIVCLRLSSPWERATVATVCT